MDNVRPVNFCFIIYIVIISSYNVIQSLRKYTFVLSDVMTIYQHDDLSSLCNPAVN
jgi:hypothetical protein